MVYNLGAQIGDRALEHIYKAFEMGWRIATLDCFGWPHQYR